MLPAGPREPALVNEQRHLRVAQAAFAAASVVFAATTGWLLSRPLLWLLGMVADDGFYYFKIATNIIHTGRSTFDGQNPTNGYHPLWMVLVTAGASLVEDKERLLRVMVGVGFVLHYVATLILIKVMVRLTSRAAAWIAGAIWLLNPFVQVLLLQGVEAPVYLFSLAVVLYVYGARIDPHLRGSAPGGVPTRDSAIFGLVLGIACLARTEAVIAGGLALALVMVALRRHGSESRAALRFGLTAGVVATLVCLPWLVFSSVTVGGFAQDSGTMKLLWGADQFAKEGTLFRIHYALFIVFRVWLDMPIAQSALVHTRGLCAALVLPPLGLAILVYRRSTGAALLFRLTIGIVVAILATGAFYGAMVGDLQIWHLVQPGLALFLLAFAWSYQAGRGWLAAGKIGRLRLGGYLILAGAGALHLRATLAREPCYPWQRDAHVSQAAFEALVPAGETIGAFNSGLPGYLGDRSIVNLDGLANHTVVAYWRRHDFSRYLEEARIRYVLDDQDSLDRALRFAGAPIRLTALHSVHLTGWRSDRVLWRIERP